MTTKSNTVGDVLIKRLTITSSKTVGASVVPSDQLVAVDIWEDMTKPTMYATLTVMDTLGMLEKFPILGEETVTIDIQTPGMPVSTKFVFRCFEVSNMQRLANGKGMSYTLRCVSEEHIRNGGVLVKESMNDIISNMIPTILAKHLQTKKELAMDPTKGIQAIAFPRLSPLEAIDMLRQRGVSKDYASSAYVFFENQAGFNFKTVEGLYKEGKQTIGTRTFNMQQNVMADSQTQAKSYRTILSHQIIRRSDTVRKVAQGAFRSVTQVFDLATKSFQSIKFNVEDKFSQLETTKKKTLPNTQEWIDEYTGGTPRYFISAKDTSRPDTFMSDLIGMRNSFAELINDEIVRVLVHGDTALKAGDVVSLTLPQVDGLSSRKKPDKFMTGDYLIIRLRHMISFNVKTTHEIVFDCVKMGV